MHMNKFRFKQSIAIGRASIAFLNIFCIQLEAELLKSSIWPSGIDIETSPDYSPGRIRSCVWAILAADNFSFELSTTHSSSPRIDTWGNSFFREVIKASFALCTTPNFPSKTMVVDTSSGSVEWGMRSILHPMPTFHKKYCMYVFSRLSRCWSRPLIEVVIWMRR